ncbi:type IV pilin N-terminal domain-containing protein [Natronococcus wangiae]|uniref:type IV pilin N-terminal domain-containing protein n=1 Tax=Natronococcus wangiae TaxID=3068275 RepID=UPI00273E6DE7|nr:type IV pilin N-terminal domain-containing protein [Natronococcus sp. AD5]
MDLKIIRNKLVGNDQERAVSPVIGVILMVAITVILAAVIAAFVLDMGDSMGDGPVNAVVGTEIDASNDNIEFTLEDGGNAATFYIRGDLDDSGGADVDEIELTSLDDVGSSEVVADSDDPGLKTTGSINIIAVGDGGEESIIGEEDWDFS